MYFFSDPCAHFLRLSAYGGPQKTGLSRQPEVARAPASPPALRAVAAPHPSYPLRGRKTPKNQKAQAFWFGVPAVFERGVFASQNPGKWNQPASMRLFALRAAFVRVAKVMPLPCGMPGATPLTFGRYPVNLSGALSFRAPHGEPGRGKHPG
jgi:hypothetical protein